MRAACLKGSLIVFHVLSLCVPAGCFFHFSCRFMKCHRVYFQNSHSIVTALAVEKATVKPSAHAQKAQFPFGPYFLLRMMLNPPEILYGEVPFFKGNKMV